MNEKIISSDDELTKSDSLYYIDSKTNEIIYSLCNTTSRHILKVPSYKLRVQRNYYYALTLILLLLEQCQWIQSLHSLTAPSRSPIWMWDQNFTDLSFVLQRSIQVSIKLFTHNTSQQGSPWLVVQTFELYTSRLCS